MATTRTFVISDLHLGGRPPSEPEGPAFQLCSSYRELADFIRWASTQSCGGALELVINGDFVDFLAEDSLGAKPWDASEENVIAKLDLIVERTRVDGRGPFDALREFSSASRRIVILLGNHDVELSLPKVRNHLLSLLTSDSGHAPTFIFDGEAYRTGSTLIEHGNRYDDWNVVDHSALREARSVLSRAGKSAELFDPPAGSRMVIEVINRVKSTYRFIDLLKPERDAVVPLLAALMPSLRSPLAVVAGYAANQTRAFWCRVNLAGQRGKLSSNSESGRATVGTDEEELEKLLAEAGFPSLEAASATRPGRRKLSSVTGSPHDPHSTLAQGSALARGVDDGDDKALADLHARLRLALTANTWRLDMEDKEYLDGAKAIVEAGAGDVVVFGHTHLPKCLEFRTATGESGRYLNTGTWADVIRVPRELDQSGPEGIAQTRTFLQKLLRNELEGIRSRYLTFAELDHTDGKTTRAQIYNYCGLGRERSEVFSEHRAP